MDSPLLVDIAFYIPLLPALVAVLKYKSMERHQKWFAFLLWSIILISFTGDFWFRSTGRNNMPFFHIYILAEFLIFSKVFYIMLKPKKSMTRAWIILAGSFTFIWVLNVFIGEGWWGFPDYIHALEAVIILSFVFKWFMKMLRERKILHPEKTFEFWMCAGLLIYFTGSFLLFLFPKFLIKTGPEIFDAIWEVTSILIILLYILYTVALLWVKKTIK